MNMIYKMVMLVIIYTEAFKYFFLIRLKVL